jgi:hypothetical protein
VGSAIVKGGSRVQHAVETGPVAARCIATVGMTFTVQTPSKLALMGARTAPVDRGRSWFACFLEWIYSLMRQLLVISAAIAMFLSLGCTNADNRPATGRTGTGASSTDGGTMNNPTGSARSRSSQGGDRAATNSGDEPAGTIASRPGVNSNNNQGFPSGTPSGGTAVLDGAAGSRDAGIGSSSQTQASGGIQTDSGTAIPGGGSAPPSNAAGNGTGPTSNP